MLSPFGPRVAWNRNGYSVASGSLSPSTIPSDTASGARHRAIPMAVSRRPALCHVQTANAGTANSGYPLSAMASPSHNAAHRVRPSRAMTSAANVQATGKTSKWRSVK